MAILQHPALKFSLLFIWAVQRRRRPCAFVSHVLARDVRFQESAALFLLAPIIVDLCGNVEQMLNAAAHSGEEAEAAVSLSDPWATGCSSCAVQQHPGTVPEVKQRVPSGLARGSCSDCWCHC